LQTLDTPTNQRALGFLSGASFSGAIRRYREREREKKREREGARERARESERARVS
jgi:hypothetical protein